MMKFTSTIFIIILAISTASCSQVSPEPELPSLPTVSLMEETRCLFEDSDQRLGEGRSWDVSLGDLDGDDDLDAFVANSAKGKIGSLVWLNDGSGIFYSHGPELNFGTGLELGDLDGDGDLDVFIVGWEEPGRVLLNDGKGIFADSGQVLGEPGGFDVGLGDLDSDGDLDVIIADEKENTVWLNDGLGNFIDSGQRLGSAPTAAAGVADLDGDGDLDLVTAGWDEPGRIWLNDGHAGFSDSGQILSSSSVHMHGLVLGDLNADGSVDIVLAGSPNQIWVNDGAGVFSELTQNLPRGPGDTAALGDIDGDGDVDVYLAVGTSGRAEDMVWINDGMGNFSDCERDLSSGFSSGVGLGDLDSDGDLDLFIAHGQLGLSNGGGLPNEVWFNENP